MTLKHKSRLVTRTNLDHNIAVYRLKLPWQFIYIGDAQLAAFFARRL